MRLRRGPRAEEPEEERPDNGDLLRRLEKLTDRLERAVSALELKTNSPLK